MKRVLSTECTHDLRGGCHPSITKDITLTAGVPVDLTPDQADFALTLSGVIVVAELDSDPDPYKPALHHMQQSEAHESVAVAPPNPEED